MDPKAKNNALLKGVNFASGGAGYDSKTSFKSQATPLSQQLEHYKTYQSKLKKVAGPNKSASIIKDALYIVSFGSSDFVQKYYYLDPIMKLYPPDQYSDLLIRNFQEFIRDLHGLGARRIGVTSLTAIGCMPFSTTLFGFVHSKKSLFDFGSKGCVSRINSDAQNFNKKINDTALSLQKELSGLKIAIFDIYTPLYELVTNPSKRGFTEVSNGCCGTGLIETSILCNPKSKTCSNASQYVFWDSVHPTEAANKVISASLVAQGISLVT